METYWVATALLLVGAIRAGDDFDSGNAMTYLYVGGLRPVTSHCCCCTGA